MEFTSQQASALKAIEDFIGSKEAEDKVFILTGYAGTGKTTLIKEIITTWKDQIPIMLMAPTGKAAKVLRERTGYEHACTIHRGIFKRDAIHINQENDDIETTDVKLFFPINSKLACSAGHLCIIDEASMVSSKYTKGEEMVFGSGVMLDDLMTFVGFNSESKIIFIGDPAQLPPFGDSASNALNPEWFKEKGYKPKHAELTEVVRQKHESIILKNSTKIRELLNSENRSTLKFETKEGELEELGVEAIINTFVDNWMTGDKGAIITFSNSMAYSYNLSIREKLGYSADLLHENERLMVVHNEISDIENPLFNGDHIDIESFSPTVETFTINVKKRFGEEVRTEEVRLSFIDATIVTDEGIRLPRKLMTNLLDSNNPGLTPNENRALYILFCIRHPEIKDKSEISKLIMDDPYYKALKVKYGYAITCHKAQGSEWKTCYIDYTGRCGLFDDALRWMYTATTRGKSNIYGVGIPNITPMSRFEFIPEIKKISKAPDNFYPETMDIPETPFHPKGTMAPVKLKYWNTSETLTEKGFSISEIQSYPWRESYIIDGCRYDAVYNSSGMFRRFTHGEKFNQDVLNILNDRGIIAFDFHYETDNQLLRDLYQKMVGLCNEHGINLTNIIEMTPYCTRYFLITEAYEYAFIDFWHNAKGQFTRAISSSTLGNDDNRIRKIIVEFSK